ncbi:MAG: DUF4383 domain-containing protein [Pseudonocardia sp.]|nr:DUF4383 domain-containing protein [Pseudonocardia sp.]
MSGQSALVASDSADSAVSRGHRRAHLTADFAASTSLGWVPGLLPREEGVAWWAEVTSFLAETADPGERRRYLRSYRRSVPQLVWTSWTSPVRHARPALAGIDNRLEGKGWDMSTVTPEDKFGIKIQSSKAPRTPEQTFSLIAGTIFIVAGVIGLFITGFSNITEVTNHALFGIFMMNPFHNIVHIALGAFWLLAAFALTPAGTEGMNIAIGGICLLATVLGWLGLFSVLSIPSGASGDNFLHLITALTTFVFGCGLFRAATGQPAIA